MKKMKKGFTLIELLIVIAIIGILAGVILVSTSTARDKANKASALETMRSMMPYAAECYMNNATLTSPEVAGSAVCTGSSANAPAFATGSGFSYQAGGSNYVYKAHNGATPDIVITCDATNSQCS